MVVVMLKQVLIIADRLEGAPLLNKVKMAVPGQAKKEVLGKVADKNHPVAAEQADKVA